MKRCKTAGGRSEFTYKGSIKSGTTINFGREGKVQINSHQWQDLLTNFRGKTVKLGTSRTEPVGLGLWLHENVTEVAIASYVGRILEEEGYAELSKLDRAIMIRFKE